MVDISLHNIQKQRKDIHIECGPGGTVHDYVPFHFATRSPMMYRMAMRSDTTPLVHIVSSVDRVQEAGLDFVFSDGHPIVIFSHFYDDMVHMNKVDWQIMEQRYWKDTEEDSDRERRRQAEFLVHGSFPWNIVESLAVKNSDMKRRLEQYLSEKWPDLVKPVQVESDWYYA